MNQFAIPAYVTVLRPSSGAPDVLGVALDKEVAIQRLTTFLRDREKELVFTERDEVGLKLWDKNRSTGRECDGMWYVSANRLLWVTCCDDIEIQELDALAPLDGEL